MSENTLYKSFDDTPMPFTAVEKISKSLVLSWELTESINHSLGVSSNSQKYQPQHAEWHVAAMINY